MRSKSSSHELLLNEKFFSHLINRICSLRRTLQTTCGIFGADANDKTANSSSSDSNGGSGSPVLMKIFDEVQNSVIGEIYVEKLRSKIIATELCREHLVTLPYFVFFP